jgi:hypothetical protein
MYVSSTTTLDCPQAAVNASHHTYATCYCFIPPRFNVYLLGLILYFILQDFHMVGYQKKKKKKENYHIGIMIFS